MNGSIINDQPFTTQNVNGTGSYPIPVTPGVIGPLKIQVKAVDTGLYSATSHAENVVGTSGPSAEKTNANIGFSAGLNHQ
jgi:hypothetical protein